MFLLLCYITRKFTTLFPITKFTTLLIKFSYIFLLFLYLFIILHTYKILAIFAKIYQNELTL